MTGDSIRAMIRQLRNSKREWRWLVSSSECHTETDTGENGKVPEDLLRGGFGIGGQAIVADAAHFRAGYGDLDVAIA
jgi:hypothetical protein